MKILAVDDDPIIIELLTLMAGRAGFTDISTAASGPIALEMITNSDTAFDCLLLDISMPDMDGIELCGLVRATPAYRETPIIMLTAMTQKGYIDRAFRAGATDYLSKPFDIVELHACLRMAQDQITAGKASARRVAKNGRRSSNGAAQQWFEITEEICIEGVRNLVSSNALGNYLTQLSRASIAGSQVVAIKVGQIDAIYTRASVGEFLYALGEVADAISDAFTAEHSLMAYAGNGAFVVVSDKARLKASAGLEAAIQDLLDERGSEFDNGDRLNIEVFAGNPIRPSAHKTQRVRKTFDRAIARAENRTSKKQSGAMVPHIRLVNE